MYRTHMHARTSEMHFPFKLLAVLALLAALAFAPLYGASAHVERPDGGGVSGSVEDFNSGGLMASFEVDGSGQPALAFESDESGSSLADIQTYDVAGIQGFVPIVDYIPGANDVESPDLSSGQAAREPFESGGTMAGIENEPGGPIGAEVAAPDGAGLLADIDRPDGAALSGHVEGPGGAQASAEQGPGGSDNAGVGLISGLSMDTMIAAWILLFLAVGVYAITMKIQDART